MTSDYGFTLDLGQPVRIEGLPDLRRYVVTPVAPSTYPVTLLNVSPVLVSRGTGTSAVVFDAHTVRILVAALPPGVVVGDYLFLNGQRNAEGFLRIQSLVVVDTVMNITVDRTLMPIGTNNGYIPWVWTEAPQVLRLTTTEGRDGALYQVTVEGLQSTGGTAVWVQQTLAMVSERPRVTSVECLEEGQVLVTFSEEMRPDAALTDPAEYQLEKMGALRGRFGTDAFGLSPFGSGYERVLPPPPPVRVRRVSPVSSTQVVLETQGLERASYRVTVNAQGTPKDLAGNPIDPAFNSTIFAVSPPVTQRSIFVDHGPIARPPLTLQAGVGVTFLSQDTLLLTGGGFDTSVLGLQVTLGGTSQNDGTYQILSVLTPTRLRVRASFTIPDAGQLLATWAVFDSRDGEIADDPAHVTVTVNGIPVRPEAVVGLLGQIVLPVAPGPADDVKVSYSWVRNPTVDLRRLNSREFKLNGWNQDTGRLHDASGHKYRYNNVLSTPSAITSPTPFQQGTNATFSLLTRIQLNDGKVLPGYTGLNIAILSGVNAGVYDIVGVPDSTHVDVGAAFDTAAPAAPWTIGDTADLQARLPQPLLRDLKYRAFERAYTASLNDPTTFRLNSPKNRIAFPLLSRTVSSSFIHYEPYGLPESDPTSPWNRVGLGTVGVVATELSVSAVPAAPGNFVYWNRDVDQTFPHVFAATWRVVVSATPVPQGVFTGVAFGYANDKKAVVVGYLLDGGVAKIGFLKRGSGNNPALLVAWSGGLDTFGSPTGNPATLDWTIPHSFRTYQDPAGVIRLYLDGGIIESLRITQDELPYLEELDTPFSTLQGVYFGHLSRTATSTSVWDYVRYTVLPTNPLQTAPSMFVSYEGNVLPEVASSPWTPIGYHGTETILSSAFLLLDSTSAVVSPTPYMGGDFRGYVRMEPLLATDAEVVLDLEFAARSWTHGITPNALTAIIDDGSRFVQLSFLADRVSPKISYGGNQLPPAPWFEVTAGAPTSQMLGRTLRVSNPTSLDALLFIQDDNAPVASVSRVIGPSDYILEARMRPLSYVADLVTGFSGVVAQAYDSTKTVGFYLSDVAGVRSVVLFGINGFGAVVVVATVPFEWWDGLSHTYRVVCAAGSDAVTLWVDGTLLHIEAYGAFTSPGVTPTGHVSFGSSIPGSQASVLVDWDYCNVWRVGTSAKRYVGMWRGHDPDNFSGYHLPTKVSSSQAFVAGNAMSDLTVDFVVAGVAVGDLLVVDEGPNKGTYTIASVAPTVLTLIGVGPIVWVAQPTTIAYRILRETDWTQTHRYRIVKDPAGSFVSVLLDAVSAPLLAVPYDVTTLPASAQGLARVVSGSVPSILWGAMDPTNLSQTSWDYVRYGITRSPTELRIAPHHEVTNQVNVVASPEHLTTDIRHAHTGYSSCSTGIPPHTSPDFLRDENLIAFTLLNEGTPLVPSTQTWEVRQPQPVRVFVAGLGSLANVLNSNGFRLNEPGVMTKLLVPDDVLYRQLTVVERTTGGAGLLTPFSDEEGPQSFGPLFYTREVCLDYDGSVLPELDTTAGTPWAYEEAGPSIGHIQRSVFGGILTYGTDGVGGTSIYRNPTPLTTQVGLGVRVGFRLKVLSDGSGGVGDSQIRFGFSAYGLTMALAFVSVPPGVRYVLCYDLTSNIVVGGRPFDYLDGAYHTYVIERAPGSQTLRILLDP